MPEGHTIHRLARDHTRALAGQTLSVSSPQGRFAAGAAELDGRVLDAVDAIGKHLFYRFEPDATLHVHLGLFGKFRTFRATPPPPTAGTRLRMAHGEGDDRVTVSLAGPTACELIEAGAEERIRARLGPDPLVAGARGLDDFAQRLRRRRIAIGAALLDQKVLAGVGNVYRAEALYVCGIHPGRPANALGEDEVASLWATLVDMLRRGVRANRIVTVEPADAGGTPRSRLRRDQAHYVYRRGGAPCRRCQTPVRSWELAGRTISACPVCQPA